MQELDGHRRVGCGASPQPFHGVPAHLFVREVGVPQDDASVAVVGDPPARVPEEDLDEDGTQMGDHLVGGGRVR